MLTSDVCCILFQLSDKEPDETGASIEEEVSSFIGRPVFLLPFIVLWKNVFNGVLLGMVFAEVPFLLFGRDALDVHFAFEDGQPSI